MGNATCTIAAENVRLPRCRFTVVYAGQRAAVQLFCLGSRATAPGTCNRFHDSILDNYIISKLHCCTALRIVASYYQILRWS